MRLLVIAEGVLARAGISALLADVADVEVIGQISPINALGDELELYQPDAAVFDLGYDPQNWLAAVASLNAPTLLLLPDDAAVYTLAAAVPAELPMAFLLRDGDPRRLPYALEALAAGLTTIDPPLAAVLLPSGGVPDETPVEKLTAREVEVLQLMAEGLTNKAIGIRLGISANTVKYHVNTILSKLDVQSRTEAVVRGSRLGLVML